METVLRRRWILNAALVALVAGLLLVLLWKPGQSPPPPPLTGLEPEDVTHIVLRQRGQPEMELAKENTGWRLVRPVAGRVNRRTVDQLLRLAHAPVLARLSENRNPAEFGLAPARATVRLDDTEIDIGGLHPVKGQIYARHGGQILLVPATHAAAATHPWHRFLDHRLLAHEQTLRALQLPGFALVHQPDGWQRHPPERELSSDRINRFVQEWQHATALAVEARTRRPAVGQITLTIRENEKEHRLVLEVVSYRQEFILRRRDEGLEYHFPEDVGRRLTVLGGE
jgi:hypothetical protein